MGAAQMKLPAMREKNGHKNNRQKYTLVFLPVISFLISRET